MAIGEDYLSPNAPFAPHSTIRRDDPNRCLVFAVVSEGEDNPDLLGHFMGWPT